MGDRDAALGEPDMVRVASEPYRQPIRTACVSGGAAFPRKHTDRFAGTVRPLGRPSVGCVAVCPLARPPGLRSSPRRPRTPIRVTGGEYAPDQSAHHPGFHRARRGRGNHCSRGNGARGLRKPHGLTAPPPVPVTHGIARASMWPASRCGDGGPARHSLEINPIRSRRGRSTPDGQGHAGRVRRRRVAEIP